MFECFTVISGISSTTFFFFFSQLSIYSYYMSGREKINSLVIRMLGEKYLKLN